MRKTLKNDQNFKLQGVLDLDLGSGRTSHRRTSLIDFYLYTEFHPNRTTKTFRRSQRDFDQVQGHVT